MPYLFKPGCGDSEESNTQYQKIKQYQLIQESDDQVTVELIVNNDSERSEFEYIISNIKRILGTGMNVQLHFVDSIEPLPSGKKLYVLSKIDP